MTCKEPEIHVSLVLEGEQVDSDVLSALIALGPSKYWEVGQFKPGGEIRYACNGCEFSTVYIGYDAHLGRFYEGLKNKDGVFEVIEEFRLSPTLSIVVYSYGSFPGIHLDATLVRDLSLSGVEVDVDVIMCGM